MRISENPFYVLGVTPEMSVEQINEAADDKCFEDEDNENKYETARSILTNPHQRLEAEVCWFYENPEIINNVRNQSLENVSNDQFTSFREVFFCLCEKLYDISEHISQSDVKNDSFAQMAKFITVLDGEYELASDDSEVSALYDEIYQSRKKASISLNEEELEIGNILHRVMESDAQNVLSKYVERNSIEGIAQVANRVGEDVIKSSIGKYPKQYHEVVRILMDLYYGKIQNTLDEQCDKIQSMIEGAKSYTECSQLQPLFNEIERFDFLAQPLQLYFQDLGQANKQVQSRTVFNALRKLAIDYTNEKQLIQLSLEITNFARRIFAENPEMVAKLNEDLAYLNGHKVLIPFQSKVNQFWNEVDRFTVRKSGNETLNSVNILSKKEQWIAILHDLASQIDQMNGENEIQATSLLALSYYHLATACTWADWWDYAYVLLREGLYYAKKSKDKELISKYMNGLQNFSNSPMVTAAIRNCNTVDELEKIKAAESEKKGKSCLITLFVIIGIIIGAIVLIGSHGQDKSPKSHTLANSSSTVTQKGNTSGDKEIQYKEPAPGNGLKLTRDEMHWVAREKIRLDTMKPLLKNNAGIKAFNDMVSYYNARGGHFKYSGNSWASAKADVEKHRDEIEEMARKEVSDNGWDVEETIGNNNVSFNNANASDAVSVFRKYHQLITIRDYIQAYDCLSPEMQNYVGNREDWQKGYASTISSQPIDVNVVNRDDDITNLRFRLKAVDLINGTVQTRYFDGTCTLVLCAGGWKIAEVHGQWE